MIKQLNLFLFTIIICLLPQHTIAQIPASPFLHYQKFHPQDSNKLFLRIENFNFVKNNEYSGDFKDGETLLGYVMSPKLTYYANSKLRIEAGVRLQKFSGLTDFSETEPLLSILYQPNKHHTLIFGSLNQNHNHGLSEPIFEPERFFTATGENGFQYIYSSSLLKFDTWFNWEQFIFSGDPFSERFTYGFSGDYKLFNFNSNKTLSIPFQGVTTHRGGEIDATNEQVQTLINLSSGIKFEKRIIDSHIKSWGIEALTYIYKDNSSEAVFVYDKGHAFEPSAWLSTKNSSIRLAYWNGFHFIAPKGSYLFQSISASNPGLGKSRRELITAKYNYSKTIGKGIQLGGKIDYYHDLNSNTAEYAAMIYISLNQSFFLKKIVPRE